MNTTNATNATPTPAAPLTPEPPQCCPACGCTEYDNNEKDFFAFECGAEGILGHAGWRVDGHECSRAFSAAIALRARLEQAEGERDTYKTMYEFAMQQHEQHETLFADYQSLNDLIGKERREHSKLTTELKRYKELMPCGHVRMLEILNDGQMPECSVCWLARTEADRNALAARVAELEALLLQEKAAESKP